MRLNGNRECRLSGQERVYCGITKLTLLAERGSAVAWSVLAEEAQVCGSCSCLQRRSLAAGTLKAWESLSVLCCKAPGMLTERRSSGSCACHSQMCPAPPQPRASVKKTHQLGASLLQTHTICLEEENRHMAGGGGG